MAMYSPIETKAVLSRRLRQCTTHNILDQTTGSLGEVAIYALVDPRDIEAARYVGQTRSPAARFRQHINAARLWLPDALPWWIKQEQLRPLYTWVRALYADGERLPLMIVVGWTTQVLAQHDERRFIRAYLAQGLRLLNREARPAMALIPGPEGQEKDNELNVVKVLE